MVVPILLYSAEFWTTSCKFTPDKWDKTPIEKQRASLLKQITTSITTFTKLPCEGLELHKIS